MATIITVLRNKFLAYFYVAPKIINYFDEVRYILLFNEIIDTCKILDRNFLHFSILKCRPRNIYDGKHVASLVHYLTQQKFLHFTSHTSEPSQDSDQFSQQLEYIFCLDKESHTFSCDPEYINFAVYGIQLFAALEDLRKQFEGMKRGLDLYYLSPECGPK